MVLNIEKSKQLLAKLDKAVVGGKLNKDDVLVKAREVISFDVEELGLGEEAESLQTIGDLMSLINQRILACLDKSAEGSETATGFKAVDVFSMLESIRTGGAVEVPDSFLRFFIDQGLLDHMSHEDFRLLEAESRLLTTQVSEDGEPLRSAIGKRNQLKKALFSVWHHLFIDKTTLVQETTECERLKGEIMRLKTAIEDANKRIEELRARISGFQETPVGFVRFTEKGSARDAQLLARLPRLGGISYGVIDAEIEKIDKSLNARYERYFAIYSKLVEMGFEQPNTEVVDYAVALSTAEGAVEEVLERASVINNYLYENGWKSYDRLKIVASVVRQKGDIQELKAKLGEVFGVLVTKAGFSNGSRRGYYTWQVASQIIGISGGTAEDKHTRCLELVQALDKREWKAGTPITNFIAAALAKMHGEPEELAENFRNFEKELVTAGIWDCRGSGIAALILMSRGGKKDAKIRRFIETFKQYDKSVSYRGKEEGYSEAARLSLMPGSFSENLLWIDMLIARFTKEGCRNNLRKRALSLMDNGWRDLMAEFVQGYQAYVPPSASELSDVSSDSDFMMMMVCYMFLADMFDVNVHFDGDLPSLDFAPGGGEFSGAGVDPVADGVFSNGFDGLDSSIMDVGGIDVGGIGIGGGDFAGDGGWLGGGD